MIHEWLSIRFRLLACDHEPPDAMAALLMKRPSQLLLVLLGMLASHMCAATPATTTTTAASKINGVKVGFASISLHDASHPRVGPSVRTDTLTESGK